MAKNQKMWSEDEVALLKKLAKKMTPQQAAEKLDRPYTSVKQKARALKIKFAKRNAGGRHAGKVFDTWSKHEVRKLRELVKTHSLRQIGEILGRSRESIYVKCDNLKIKVRDHRLSNVQLAEMLGISIGALDYYKRKLNMDFSTMENPRPPTDEEIGKIAHAILTNHNSQQIVPVTHLREMVKAFNPSLAA